MFNGPCSCRREVPLPDNIVTTGAVVQHVAVVLIGPEMLNICRWVEGSSQVRELPCDGSCDQCRAVFSQVLDGLAYLHINWTNISRLIHELRQKS